MKYISLCSGIEAATVAVKPLGWTPVAFSEIDPVCNRFLLARYPDVPNLGSMLKVDWTRWKADVLIGGTPCQTFTTMGRWRREIQADSDPRGKLAFSFLDIAHITGVDWFIWENVANVLTVQNGKVFARWLRRAESFGFAVGWRVLDTNDFGLPTTRSRLYAVGYRGEGSRLHAIERSLFQPRDESGRSLQAYPKGLRGKQRSDTEADESYSVGFDGAGIGPRGRHETLPTLTKGHAGRFGLVTRQGDVRKVSCEEAELSMGFTMGYTNAGGLSFRDRHACIGNSFSPRVIRAIARGITHA